MKKQAKPAGPIVKHNHPEIQKRANDKGRGPSTTEAYPGPRKGK